MPVRSSQQATTGCPAKAERNAKNHHGPAGNKEAINQYSQDCLSSPRLSAKRPSQSCCSRFFFIWDHPKRLLISAAMAEEGPIAPRPNYSCTTSAVTAVSSGRSMVMVMSLLPCFSKWLIRPPATLGAGGVAALVVSPDVLSGAEVSIILIGVDQPLPAPWTGHIGDVTDDLMVVDGDTAFVSLDVHQVVSMRPSSSPASKLTRTYKSANVSVRPSAGSGSSASIPSRTSECHPDSSRV